MVRYKLNEEECSGFVIYVFVSGEAGWQAFVTDIVTEFEVSPQTSRNVCFKRGINLITVDHY